MIRKLRHLAADPGLLASLRGHPHRDARGIIPSA